MMGLFGKLANLGIDIATSPIAIVSDVITLGGSCTDDKSKIAKKVKQLSEDLNEIKSDLKK
jgi:hypothetical protein